jgi:hypothetical protein
LIANATNLIGCALSMPRPTNAPLLIGAGLAAVALAIEGLAVKGWPLRRRLRLYYGMIMAAIIIAAALAFTCCLCPLHCSCGVHYCAGGYYVAYAQCQCQCFNCH